MDFGSTALGTGKCLIALIPLAELTSLLIVAVGFATGQVFTCVGEEGAEMTQQGGFMPIREIPFGVSLLRTVLFDSSTGFTPMLEQGGGREMVSVLPDTVLVGDLTDLDPSIMGLQAIGLRVITGGLFLSP